MAVAVLLSIAIKSYDGNQLNYSKNKSINIGLEFGKEHNQANLLILCMVKYLQSTKRYF